LESDRRVANGVAVYACGGNAATMVHELTQAAFAGYEALDPPSGASRETAESVRRDLEAAGGALAWLDSRPVGCLRFVIEADHLHVRRVAVTPELQGLGIGRALMAWAEAQAIDRRLSRVTVGVRLSLPGNLGFYRRLGYEVIAEHAHPGYDRPTWVLMQKTFQARAAEQCCRACPPSGGWTR